MSCAQFFSELEDAGCAIEKDCTADQKTGTLTIGIIHPEEFDPSPMMQEWTTLAHQSGRV